MVKTTLAGVLREVRDELGLSQEQLAQRLGVAWSTVSRWENERGAPSPLAREKVDKLLRESGLAARAPELNSSKDIKKHRKK